MESIFNTVLSVLIGFIVTLIFNGIVNFPKKKKAEEAKKAAEEKAKHEKLEEDIHLLKKGMQVQLKNELKVRYDYWLDEGYAPDDARDDLEAEYRIYHDLGKNGVMDDRRRRFLQLPKQHESNVAKIDSKSSQNDKTE